MAQKTASVNNDFYDDLGSLWETGSDHPIALLRAENRVRNPWILAILEKFLGVNIHFLDIGCGGGWLTNFLASQNLMSVEGIDLSFTSLEHAKNADPTKKVIYRQANALCLPHKNACFDAVSSMDILEHVEYPEDLIKEAARVLLPGGLFFFHTFNRNFFSWITVIKGLEWFVKNTPKNLHLYRFFIKPKELLKELTKYGLELVEIHGFSPVFFQPAMMRMLMTGTIEPDFRFHFSRSLLTGYCGYARKLGPHSY